MLSISEFQDVYQKIKSTKYYPDFDLLNETDRRIFQSFSEFTTTKFFETSSIFLKFDYTSIFKFSKESIFENFEQNQNIFTKGQECDSYYFVLYGDINLYDEESEIDTSRITCFSKLIKTISGGSIYGHKIKSKFNYLALAKNFTQLLKISKIKFNSIIDETNKRKDQYKINFLKKFFPRLRMYSEDVIGTLKPFFIREEHYKGNKILIDSEYDEYLYLVINGSLGIAKSIKKLKNLKDKISRNLEESNNLQMSGILDCKYSEFIPGNFKYVVLEKFNKGDVFGAYSALKHHKNNYSVIVLSERAQLYKISKAHCIYYLGGSTGIIPETLRGIDNTQQSSIQYKIDFLENSDNLSLIKRFLFIGDEEETPIPKKTIDESHIENKLKDAWKELENLGSKITQFKENLLNKNTSGASKQLDLFAKPKANTNEPELTDHSKVMGFGTNRVVSKGLNKTSLSATQMKGMSTLQNICGVKKNPEVNKDTDKMMLKRLSSIGESNKKSKIFDHLEEEDKSEKGEENVSNLVHKFKKFKSCEISEPMYTTETDIKMNNEDKFSNPLIPNNETLEDPISKLNTETNFQNSSITNNTPVNKFENPSTTSVNLNKNPKRMSLKNLL